jgi:hypothetical protein
MGACFRAMRGFLAICAVLAGAYWIDRTYYFGEYTRQADMLLYHIVTSFK